MFRLIFCTLGFLISIYFIIEAIYHFPIIALDGCVLLIGIFLYQLIKKLKRRSFKGFLWVVAAGSLISFVNMLPIKVPETDFNSYISTRGVIRHMIEYKPHEKRVKSRKVHSLFKFCEVAKKYFIIFIMKHFYIVFISALLVSEIRAIHIPFVKKADQNL